MRKKHVKKRKIRRVLRKVSAINEMLFSIPALKSVLVTAAAICMLLVLVPYAVTSMVPETSEKDAGSGENISSEKAEIPKSVRVFRTEKNTSETVDFEEYIKGVVASEMPSRFHIEALKAQSVAARTYSIAKIINSEENVNPKAHPDAPLCDSTHCQVYKSTDELDKIKGDAWMKSGWKKVCKAVDATNGELLYYKGQLVQQALFHSSSGGKTENCEDVFAAAVPYLVSVESPYEKDATHQNEKHSFSINELSAALKSAYPYENFGTISAGNIKIVSRSSGNRVEKIQIGSAALTGRQVREALELPSANFTVKADGKTVTFISNGSGHGVGMSQYGADGMAKKGCSYKKILSHYYSGTEVY